jgi:class 3 adenylate cyclase/predicted ATPase
MPSSRESLIHLAGLGVTALTAVVAHHYEVGDAASLFGSGIALLGSVAHASFGHIGLEFVHDLAKRFGGEHSPRGRENRDLHRLIGGTIARILEDSAKGAQDEFGARWLKEAAQAFRGESWMSIELTGSETAVSEPRILNYFSGDSEIIKNTPVLQPVEWTVLVEKVVAPTRTVEAEKALNHAVAQLHVRFAFELWQSAKDAWKQADLAWPALILRLLSELLGQAAAAVTEQRRLCGEIGSLRDMIVKQATPAMNVAAPADVLLVNAIHEYEQRLTSQLDRIETSIHTGVTAIRSDIADLRTDIASAFANPSVGAATNRWIGQLPEGRVTIIFAEIEGSEMNAASKGGYWDELKAEHNRRIYTTVGEHRGYFVKTIGDRSMIVFQAVVDAVHCSIQILRTMKENPIQVRDSGGKPWKIAVSIGVHLALEHMTPRPSPLCSADYFGSDANFAARIGALAGGGQLIVSDSTFQALRTSNYQNIDTSWVAWPDRRIRSFTVPETVFEFVGDEPSRGEPGSRFVSAWFKGDRNHYIPRPELEAEILAQFGVDPNGTASRMVTLHGYGGTGKTRLAIACALRGVGAFSDGVFFVRLDEIVQRSDRPSTAVAVAEAIGEAMRLAPEWRVPSELVDLFKRTDKDALLLLDNYESVDSDEVRRFLATLLKSTTRLRFLVTGRENVKLSDVETEISIDCGMSETEAVELFLARVRLKSSYARHWLPNPEERKTISSIVSLTEYLPLAIEIAAAWAGRCTFKEIAEGIAATALGPHSEQPPRAVHVGGSERHRSLTRSLDWSFALLEQGSREGLIQLGTFAGTFTLESVKGACNLPRELLMRLEDASLLHRIEIDGHSRYTMRRPTREYVVDKLSAASAVSSFFKGQFTQYFLKTAKSMNGQTAPGKDTGDKLVALDWFEIELPNLLAAGRYAFELEDWVTVWELSETVDFFWDSRGHSSEIGELYDMALLASRNSKRRAWEAKTSKRLGALYLSENELVLAAQYFRESLMIYAENGETLDFARILHSIAGVVARQGRLAEAEKLLKQSLVITRRFNDPPGEAATLSNLGRICSLQLRPDEAEAYFQESLRIARESRDRRIEQASLDGLRFLFWTQKRLREAEVVARESLEICRELRDRRREARVLSGLGLLCWSEERSSEAESFYIQSLTIYRDLGEQLEEAGELNTLGDLYGRRKSWLDAERCYQEALIIFTKFRDRYKQAWSLSGLGSVHKAFGRLSEAEQCYCRCFDIHHELGQRSQEGDALLEIALLKEEQGYIPIALDFARLALETFGDNKDKLEKLQRIIERLERTSDPGSADTVH